MITTKVDAREHLLARAESEDRRAHLAAIAYEGTSLPETRPALQSVRLQHEYTARVLREEAALLDALDHQPPVRAGLPVIKTCDVCAWRAQRKADDGRVNVCTNVEAERAVSIRDAPPAWCPLRTPSGAGK